MTFQSFIDSLTHDPNTRTRLAPLYRAFVGRVYDPAAWSRTRFVLELGKAGYEVAKDTSGLQVVLGLALDERPRRWTVVDGRCVRAVA